MKTTSSCAISIWTTMRLHKLIWIPGLGIFYPKKKHQYNTHPPKKALNHHNPTKPIFFSRSNQSLGTKKKKAMIMCFHMISTQNTRRRRDRNTPFNYISLYWVALLNNLHIKILTLPGIKRDQNPTTAEDLEEEECFLWIKSVIFLIENIPFNSYFEDLFQGSYLIIYNSQIS